MRRWAGAGGFLLVLSALLATGPAWAQTTSSTSSSTTTTFVFIETVVTVEPGPAQRQLFVPPCNDIAVQFDQRLSFVLRRIGPTTAPLTVTYQLSGTAQPGVHFDPLPGTATFPADASSVTVTVVPRQTPDGAFVNLRLTVTGGTALAPPTPPTASIDFVSPFPPGPRECGYRFADDAWNTAQSILAGDSLRALTLVQLTPPVLSPATGVFRLVAGALPTGVTLRSDGSFSGTATTAGTFTAQIEACRPAPPGTCVTTTLTVTVTGTTPPRVLVRTGPAASLHRWAALAWATTVLGAMLMTFGRVRPAVYRRRRRRF